MSSPDPFLDALANLQPGDPLPELPLEEQVDGVEFGSLAELVDLHLRIHPDVGPPLTPEEDERKRQLWAWFRTPQSEG